MEADAFDEILGLEERFYEDGYQQGLADGIKVGRIEGRTFGMEKGFEKYVESGRLYGKSLIWANREAQSHQDSVTSAPPTRPGSSQVSLGPHSSRSPPVLKLPRLLSNTRLSKSIKTLHALAESESLSTENSEGAVADFDDRYKRAYAKAKIIERIVGEARYDPEGQGKSSADRSIEDVSVLSARH